MDYIEVPVAGGISLVVESAEAAPGTIPAGRLRDLAESATETFDYAMVRVRSAAGNVLQRVNEMAEPPDEVTVQFAVKLATQAGVVIANTSAEANLSVTLKWNLSGTVPPAHEPAASAFESATRPDGGSSPS